MAIVQFGQTKCSYLQDAMTSALLKQKNQVNKQSQGVKTQPEEEGFWQAEALAPAKAGTPPVTCGRAKGCQVWDKYFF